MFFLVSTIYSDEIETRNLQRVSLELRETAKLRCSRIKWIYSCEVRPRSGSCLLSSNRQSILQDQEPGKIFLVKLWDEWTKEEAGSIKTIGRFPRQILHATI
jgi:hypothetical protein